MRHNFTIWQFNICMCLFDYDRYIHLQQIGTLQSTAMRFSVLRGLQLKDACMQRPSF